jgi:hypothetical protein
MKLVKTQIVLFIFDELFRNGYIDPKFIKNEFNLNDKTLFRYISEIKSYFFNFYKGYDITYHREKKLYYLVNFTRTNIVNR